MAKSLLLADDSSTFHKVVELCLAPEDVSVVAARSADEALQRVRELRPDIVLADSVMPGRSGYDLAAQLKADPATAHIPVLLLASANEPFDEGRARAARVDGVLPKPFQSQALVDQVRALLTNARPAATQPGPVRTAQPMAQPAAQIAAQAVTQPPAPRPPMPQQTMPPAPRPVAPGVPAGATPRPPGAATVPPAPRPGVPGAPAGATPRPPGAATMPPAVRPAAPGAPAAVGATPRPPIPGAPSIPPVPRPAAPGAAPRLAVPPPVRPAAPGAVPGAAPGGATPGPAAARPPAPTPGPVAAGRPTMPPPARPGAVPGAAPGAIPGGATPAPTAARPAPAPQLTEANHAALLREALTKASREMIEKVIWEVVPELAETLIREELGRLVKERQTRGD